MSGREGVWWKDQVCQVYIDRTKEEDENGDLQDRIIGHIHYMKELGTVLKSGGHWEAWRGGAVITLWGTMAYKSDQEGPASCGKEALMYPVGRSQKIFQKMCSDVSQILSCTLFTLVTFISTWESSFFFPQRNTYAHPPLPPAPPALFSYICK